MSILFFILCHHLKGNFLMQKKSTPEQLNWRKHYMSTVMDNGEVHSWYVPSLWRLVEPLPVIKILVYDIYQTVKRHIEEEYIAEDWKRVAHADLSYPIIVNDLHGVVDGVHRIAKSYQLNKRYINAKRIKTMPEPDMVFDTVEDYDSYFAKLS